jgi:hypothetical protein
MLWKYGGIINTSVFGGLLVLFTLMTPQHSYRTVAFLSF